MKLKYALCATTAAFAVVLTQPASALVVDFSDLTLPAAESFHNNSAFASGGAGFNNTYSLTYGSWGGFAYSNTTDTTTAGYGNQYSAITGTNGSGVAGGIYAVAYEDTYTPTTPRIDFPIGYTEPVSIQLTNTTYTYLTLKDGNGFSLPFASGDWFKVAITGYSSGNASLGSLDFYLADYRSADWYIVNQWTSVDLTSMGSGVSYLTMEFASSDTGFYGINTPAYTAVGGLTVIPEPSGLGLLGLGLALLGGGGVFRRARGLRIAAVPPFAQRDV